MNWFDAHAAAGDETLRPDGWLGSEPVRIGGTVCGRVTSGGYGYRVSASIAYAFVPSTVVAGTAVEVGVFGEWYPAVVRDEPLYDPSNTRVRA